MWTAPKKRNVNLVLRVHVVVKAELGTQQSRSQLYMAELFGFSDDSDDEDFEHDILA